MATIERSLLKPDKKTGKSEISLRFCGGRGKGLTVRVGSMIYISPKRFKSDGSIIVPRTRTQDLDEILGVEEKLENLERLIINEFNNIPKSAFSKEWLQNLVSTFHAPIIKNVPTGQMKVLEFLDYYIKNKAPYKLRKRDGLKLQPNAIQQYNATNKHSIAFIRKVYKTDIEFNQLNEEYYYAFVNYLQNLNFTQNTVGKHIRILKTLINDAPLELRRECDISKFVVINVDVESIYLTEEELNKIWKTDLSDSPEVEIARDWFLIACWTGSRYSDLQHFVDIKVEKKTKTIKFNQQKTSTNVVIPIHPIVYEIYEKYNWILPEVVLYHNINDYIRTAVKMAGIDDEIIIQSTEGGKKVKNKFKKFELVSTHTGRRSFCTNMYLRKIPIYQIMAVSGHKTEKNFLKYIKVSAQQYADMMSEEWTKIYSNDIKNQGVNVIKLQNQIEQLTNEKNALKSQILDLNNEKEELNNQIIKQQKEIIGLKIALRNL